MKRLARALILAAAWLTGPATAQEMAACKAVLAPAERLKFDDEKHRKFYRRFWTGECAGLSIFEGAWCIPGEPNWNKGVGELALKHGLAAESEAFARLCRLGRSMGHEWARENDVRFICTSDLKVWMPELARAGDLDAALKVLEQRVAERLTTRTSCQK